MPGRRRMAEVGRVLATCLAVDGKVSPHDVLAPLDTNVSDERIMPSLVLASVELQVDVHV